MWPLFLLLQSFCIPGFYIGKITWKRLASLHVSGGISVAPRASAEQRNLVRSTWSLAGQYSPKSDSHRRRGLFCSPAAAKAVLVGPAYPGIPLNFSFRGVSPYFCWLERKEWGQQSLIALHLITFLYLSCYYYNSVETWRQSKKPFYTLAPCGEENQYKWTKTTQIEHYM